MLSTDRAAARDIASATIAAAIEQIRDAAIVINGEYPNTAAALLENVDTIWRSMGDVARDAKRYRLLTHADVIEPGDEWLRPDAHTWHTDVNSVWIGRNYIPGALLPARRRTDAAPAAPRAGGEA